MAAQATSTQLILEAARKVVVERGEERLTVSAVAEAAGVSRVTLYRWFPTRQDLFAAIRADEKDRFEVGLQAAVAEHHAPARRLESALHFLVTYLDQQSMGRDPVTADPATSLQAFRDGLAPRVESLVLLLGDAFRQVPAVRDGDLTMREAAEMFVRLAFSHFLLPHPDSERLLFTIRGFAGLPNDGRMHAVG